MEVLKIKIENYHQPATNYDVQRVSFRNTQPVERGILQRVVNRASVAGESLLVRYLKIKNVSKV